MGKENINVMRNRWLSGALPALLIHCCIGSVYCWSLLKGDIASYMGIQPSHIELSFMLAIFFLGMSAAFGGNFVEKKVKLSSIISTVMFCGGLLLSALSVCLKLPTLLYLSYGVIMGIGLGIGYISPVKTLMLWFGKYKGFATGIAISGFGMSKMLFSPLIQHINNHYGVIYTLLVMCAISLVCMSLASYLIKKPFEYIEETDTNFSIKSIKDIILDYRYIIIWIMFFINITCGLLLISFEKEIIGSLGLISYVGLIASLTAFFNTVGRFGYATLSDYIKPKIIVFLIIFITCVSVMLNVGYLSNLGIISALLTLIIVNMGYGGGFSTLPTLLTDYFSMKQISTIHGFALSAWAWASVAAYMIAQFFIYKLNYTFTEVFNILGILYTIGMVSGLFLLIKSANIEKAKKGLK